VVAADALTTLWQDSSFVVGAVSAGSLVKHTVGLHARSDVQQVFEKTVFGGCLTGLAEGYIPCGYDCG